jgi:hypothetical protein
MRALTFLSGILGLSACASVTDVREVPPEPAFRVDSLWVAWRDTARAHVSGLPDPHSSIVWGSLDTTIARVDSSGVVTGVRQGATLITARVGTVSVAGLVTVELRMSSIAPGYRSTCGILPSATTVCWAGALKIHGTAAANLEVSGGGSPELGGGITCARTAIGGVECWGLNMYFVSGGGPFLYSYYLAPTAVQLPEPATYLRSGPIHSCALGAAGDAYCWGLDYGGSWAPSQLCVYGRTPYYCTATPVRVGGTLRFKEIVPGVTTTCGITIDDAVRCWGAGFLPGSGHVAASEPAAIPFSGPAHGLILGHRHACALAASGEAYCWGANDRGQLGIGTPDSALHAPLSVAGALRFVSLAARFYTTCGVTTNHVAYCWGANDWGQLGDGSAADRASPVRVLLDDPVRDIVTGGYHSCALTLRGVPYCWGEGSAGQLGNGQNSASTVPVRPMSSVIW